MCLRYGATGEYSGSAGFMSNDKAPEKEVEDCRERKFAGIKRVRWEADDEGFGRD